MTLKRFIAAALALLLLFGMTPELLPTAQAEPEKSGCTSRRSPTGLHAWYSRSESASCEFAGGIVWTCSFCGKQVAEQTEPALGHDWADWVEVEPPTCTDTGLRQRTCQRCKKTERQSIPALGHSFTREWKTVIEPTCIDAGREMNTCVRCGYEWWRDIPAAGHQWSDWAVKTPPTEGITGTQTRLCAVCGAVEERPYDAESHESGELILTARVIDPKSAYQAGDVVAIELTLTNGTGESVSPAAAWSLIDYITCDVVRIPNGDLEPGAARSFTLEHTIENKEAMSVSESGGTGRLRIALMANAELKDGSYPYIDPAEIEVLVAPNAGTLTLYAYPTQLPASMTAGNTIKFEAYMSNYGSLHMIDGYIAMGIGGEFYSESYVAPDKNGAENILVEFEHEITLMEEAEGLLTVTFTGMGAPDEEEYREIRAKPVVLTFALGEETSRVIFEVSPEYRPEGNFTYGAQVKIPLVLRVEHGGPLTLERFVYRNGDAVTCDDEMEARFGLKTGQTYSITYIARVTNGDMLRREGKRTLSIVASDTNGVLYTASCEPEFLIVKKTESEHIHRFGSWKLVVPPTRRQNGVRQRRCLTCGYTELETIEATPRFTTGQSGKKVELLQHILDDLGYKPNKISGVIDEDFWKLIADWARDRGWYYEPGLLRPIEVDEIVRGWLDQDDLIAVSGEGKDVNIVFTVTPERKYDYADSGEELAFTWQAVNLGTEDCRLGPVLLSFGDDNLSADVREIYRFVADLDGNTLKAGGANTLSGSFTVTADFDQTQDRVSYDPDAPVEKMYGRLTVNARALGTSLATNRKWYSNAWTKTYTVFKTSKTVSPDLVVTAEVLNEKEYYCAGDPLEYRVGLTYTGEIELYGGTLNVLLIGADEQASIYTRFFETLKPGETFSEQTECILGDRFTREDRIELRAEASGLTPEGETVLSEPCCLHVNGHPQRDPDALALVFALEEPDRVYALGERVPFTVRLENKTDEPLTDYTIRVSIGDGLHFPTAQEYNGPIVPANGSTALYTGALPVPAIYYGDIGAVLQASATACTKDGRPVEAEPLSLGLSVDEDKGSVPAGQLLLKVTQTSPAKAEYAVGDEITFRCELKMTDTDTMPAFMSIHVTADDGATADAVCDGEAFSGFCAGEYTLTLKEKDVTDGCVNAVFTGVCAMEAGEPYSHNSNRITFTFPVK